MKLTTFSRCSMVILLAGLDFIQMMQSTQVPELFGTLRMCAMSVTLSCSVSRSSTLIPTVVFKIDSAIHLIYPSTHWKSIRETSCLIHWIEKRYIYWIALCPFEQLGPDCNTSLSQYLFLFQMSNISDRAFRVDTCARQAITRISRRATTSIGAKRICTDSILVTVVVVSCAFIKILFEKRNNKQTKKKQAKSS